jgi:hypothetical protein
MDHLAPRIISFGCSYTQYIYPTYADILKTTNRGVCGTGNDRIFYDIMQSYKNKELDDYDHVIVQWTSQYRFDYLKKDGWTFPDGNITVSRENKNIWKRLQYWFNEEYEYEKLINYMTVVENLIPNVIFMTMTDIDYPNLFLNHFESITGDYEFEDFKDKHPTIMQHIEVANKLAVKLDITLDREVLTKCFEIDKTIKKTKHFSADAYTITY